MATIMRFARTYPVVIATIITGMLGGALWAADLPQVARVVVTGFAAAFALWTAIDMTRALLRREFGLDVLALMAIVSTLVVGEYWASLVVVLMLSGGEALEDYASARAKRELTALLDLSPTVAHLYKDETTVDVDVDTVTVGDLLLVRPGEALPVDSTLVSDYGEFDEASITGESLPVSRRAGDEVPSGAINGDAAVTVRAVRVGADSQYQQIVRLVRESEDAKAPVVRLADRFAVPFTLISVIIAGAAWAVSGHPIRFAEVLVLATPCPLLIAAPVAFMGGMSRASRAGIVVKGGAVLEQAAHVRSIAFDKTGTLTVGSPRVVALRPIVEGSEQELLRVAAAVEQYSPHVLAVGIREAAAQLELPIASNIREEAGRGLDASVDGHRVTVGLLEYVREAAPDAVSTELQAGQTAVYVARAGSFLGAIILADAIRPEAPAILSTLRAQGIDNIALLTGDGHQAASAVATQLGITTVHSGLRPADKIRVARNLSPKPTMMVGDGVNDAPVLAAADVGIAMGARGATAAGEAADAVILHDSLYGVPSLVTISRDTLRIALTAIWIGIVLSVGLMLVATTGAIPAVAGAGIQEILDLITILYALRALRETGAAPDRPLTQPRQAAEKYDSSSSERLVVQ